MIIIICPSTCFDGAQCKPLGTLFDAGCIYEPVEISGLVMSEAGLVETWIKC